MTEYFTSARLTRQQARDSAITTLRDAAESESAAAEAVSGALDAITVMARYTVAEAEIEALIREAGEEVRAHGLDRNAVEASMNRVIFHLREEDEPQGIGRCIRCMDDWMYGGDPGEALESEELARRLKAMLEDGSFDRLAAEVPEARLLLQVHDELIAECPEALGPRVAAILTEEMQGAADFPVPLTAEAHTGRTWYDAK